jgi:hypothetical protein
VWENNEIHIIFWFETLKGRDHLEDLGIDRKIILEWMLENRVGGGELDA